MSLMLLVCAMVMGEPRPMVYAAGYIPNVQFAPFYVAEQKGYYREEGIALTMDYTMGPDVFKLVAVGKVHVGSADPDAFLHAAIRGLPLVHLATLYQDYPIALIAREDILTPQGLKGKRIGISGTYGSSYLGLKAMLHQMGLGLKDVRVASIGFTQAASLRQERVDVVVGYVNNEPLRLRGLGLETHTYMLEGSSRIPGVGLMTSRKFLAAEPDLIQGFLRATFRGMEDVIANPEACFALVVKHYLPGLTAKDKYDAELAVLRATIPFWETAYTKANGHGQCDEVKWHQLAGRLSAESNNKAYQDWQKFTDRSFNSKP